jgi:hypothetical protein
MLHPRTIPAPATDRRTATPAVWLSVYAPVTAALALRLASEPTANASYLALAVYALVGRAHAIRALALCWLFTMLNSGIAPEASAASVGRYAVLFGAAASALLHGGFGVRHLWVHPFTLMTVLLGLFIVGHSMMFSPITDVSVLKAVSWMLAMATLVAAWCGMSDRQRAEVSQQLYWGLVMVLVVSLPLAVSPTGYLVNGTGFQGVLNQPQAFGSTMALLWAWTTARVLGERRPSWWLLAVAATTLAAVLMSEARTAGLAMVLGLGLSVLLGPVFARQSILFIAPGLRSRRVWALLMGVSLAAVALAPVIAALLQNYLNKSGRAEVVGLMEAYDHSRGGLMEAMLANIAEHPLTGIGFGIASEPSLMVVERDPVLGLPTSAAIEKGVTLLMVLEELGVFGAAFVALWIWRLLRGGARSGLAPFAICLTALLLNMGEATLFSPGGFGLLLLVLLGWAYASGRPRGRPAYG